jgi:hypothetical protein
MPLITAASRRSWTLPAAAVAVATLGVLASTPAHAYKTYKPVDCTPGRSWDDSTPVQIRIHGGSATAVVGANEAAMRTDVQYVIDQFNGVAGVSLDLVAGADTGGTYDDDVYNVPGAVQIGFYAAGHVEDDEEEGAPAWAELDNADPCDINQVNLTFSYNTNWGYGTPEDNGSSTPWMNGRTLPTGGLLFRIILMHELGHALGLSHPDDEYAMMDHGEKTWTGGASEYQAEYLPDDRAGFRALYPDPIWGEVDVAITNTWHGHPNIADAAAQQLPNCMPARMGGIWVDKEDSDFCAPWFRQANVICPGESIQVRYTLNNQGTANRDVDEHLWFSEDGVLGFSDYLSPTSYSHNLTGAKSRVRSRIYESPANIAPGVYWPIAHISHDLPGIDESVWNDMLPLNGVIIVLEEEDCTGPRIGWVLLPPDGGGTVSYPTPEFPNLDLFR